MRQGSRYCVLCGPVRLCEGKAKLRRYAEQSHFTPQGPSQNRDRRKIGTGAKSEPAQNRNRRKIGTAGGVFVLPSESFGGKRMATLTPRFESALSYAAALHRTQLRKASAIPYVAHLLAVASLVIEHGGDEDEAIAALLHDAIEDQGGSIVGEEIRRQFGDRVAEIVIACSDAFAVPKPPWRERKQTHLDHVADAPAAVKLVVAADKLHNARSLLSEYRRLGETMWSHFHGGKVGTLWYYRAALEAVRSGAPADLVAQLEEAVARLEQLGAS
jgi:GTP pyrophosphokinase